MDRYILVYDADCGPCTRFKRGVDWLDKYNHLSYVSLIEADQRGLLDSVPIARRHKSFHMISALGNVSSGSHAVPILLGLLPLGGLASKLILLFPPGQSIMDFVYATFARLHESGLCSSKPSSRTSFTNREVLYSIKKNTKRERRLLEFRIDLSNLVCKTSSS